MVRAGLLDDERFALMFVADKRELEQWGSERIRRGLRPGSRSRSDRARRCAQAAGRRRTRPSSSGRSALLRRRFPEPPRDRRERDRALGVLLRKGYDSELALDALGAYARATEDRAWISGTSAIRRPAPRVVAPLPPGTTMGKRTNGPTGRKTPANLRISRLRNPLLTAICDGPPSGPDRLRQLQLAQPDR